MMKLNYILIVLFLVACSSTKKLTENSVKPTKFVFKKSIVSSQKGMSDFNSQIDSLVDTNINSDGKDSLMNQSLKELRMPDFLTQAPDTEIHLEIQNDSIWRSTRQNEKMIGDYFMIQKNSGVLNYYDKSKSVNYSKYDLFAENDEYEIIENRNDIKEIEGFDCYKLTLIKKDTESDLGNTIYEMYVTNQIELPIHAVINLSKMVSNTFPMEIRISEENLSGIIEQYQLIKIE